VGQVLRKAGAPAESPEQLELARQLYKGLVREAPGESRHLVRLSDTWYQLGQSRRKLGEHEAAFTAYRQAVQAQRSVFDRAPEMPEYRQKLSLRYNRLAYWLRQRGCLAEAAANLLEQKKLWPGNGERLREISGEFAALAAEGGRGRRELTPSEQEERKRYREFSAQLEREAAAAQPVSGRAKP
jgi:tetratricopeptide (TPR) repeat protein